MPSVLPLIAEFMGTFLFVMSILITGNPLVIGATLALIIWLLTNTSGGHLNPAVSLAFWLRGNLDNLEYIGYIGAQFLAGASALYTYKALV
jgi:glycerol uptake facilitator-like aquaporin